MPNMCRTREKSSAACYNTEENFERRRLLLEKIRLAAAKCIRGSLQPPCRACEDVCPAGAFRWGVPHSELCIDCGLCTAVCPAAAIETRLDYAARLTRAAAARKPCVREKRTGLSAAVSRLPHARHSLGARLKERGRARHRRVPRLSARCPCTPLPRGCRRERRS